MLQLTRLGDVLLTTPLARAVHHLFPEARIDFLTEPANHLVLAGNPHLTRLWAYPPRGGFGSVLSLARALRRERYDLSLDTLGDPRSVVIGVLAQARLRVGYDVRAPRRWAYHKVVERDPAKYTVDRKLDLVRWLGSVPSDLQPEYYIPEGARAAARAFWRDNGLDGFRVAALSPVSRKAAKRWSPSAFAEAADGLAAEGCAILLLWGPGEEGQIAEVRGAMRSSPVGVDPPPPIPLLAAMIERASILVGNDNGMKHLAVASGTPTVTVHTVSRASSWNPPNDPRHVALELAGDRPPLDPADVVRAALEVLAISRASPGPGTAP
jgi:ADP-heptose:LPS heptosyltransferase